MFISKREYVRLVAAYEDAMRLATETAQTNGKIINYWKEALNSNTELIAINKALIDRVDDLEKKLKEASEEQCTCTNDSENA